MRASRRGVSKGEFERKSKSGEVKSKLQLQTKAYYIVPTTYSLTENPI